MNEFALPARWLLAGPLIAVGVLVVTALLGGEAFSRWLRLPRIVGYAATGIALGAIGIVPPALRDELRLAIDFCMGAVLFELGARIDLGWLRRAPWLAALALGESALAGVTLYWVLSALVDLPPGFAAVGAALGVSTSPAVALRVAQDVRAQGQVTERMLMLSATSTAVTVVALAMLLPMLGPAQAPLAVSATWAGAISVALALALAAGLAVLALLVFQAIGKRREAQITAAFGAIALAAGLAAAAELSIPLVLFAFGIGVRTIDRRHRLMPLDFERAGQLVTVLLFALVGASLELGTLAAFGFASVAFILALAVAKGSAVIVFARATRQPLQKAALLALTLQPMSGITVVLAQDAARAIPALGTTVVPVVLAAVIAFELLGPLCTQAGLRLAGEAEPLAA
ncbi:MAG TPA: cation:proton antiporter [Myxococcota bacterium]|nr:cation:proton antiporter [Myxococcota bacterium]